MNEQQVYEALDRKRVSESSRPEDAKHAHEIADYLEGRISRVHDIINMLIELKASVVHNDYANAAAAPIDAAVQNLVQARSKLHRRQDAILNVFPQIQAYPSSRKTPR